MKRTLIALSLAIGLSGCEGMSPGLRVVLEAVAGAACSGLTAGACAIPLVAGAAINAEINHSQRMAEEARIREACAILPHPACPQTTASQQIAEKE